MIRPPPRSAPSPDTTRCRSIDAAGNWTFTLDQGAADHLAEGASDTQTFTATVTSEKHATEPQTQTTTVTRPNLSQVERPGGSTDTAVDAGHPRPEQRGATQP